MRDMGCNAVEGKPSMGLSTMEESTKQRLERQKKWNQEKIDDIDEALALLEKYPDMEKLTDLLRRI